MEKGNLKKVLSRPPIPIESLFVLAKVMCTPLGDTLWNYHRERLRKRQPIFKKKTTERMTRWKDYVSFRSYTLSA